MEVCRGEKNRAYIVTAVDRITHTIVGWAVCRERTLEILQSVIDGAPPAADYYTDGFLMYQDLSYWGNHTMLKDKSQTYSVEGGNADLSTLSGASDAFFPLFLALLQSIGESGRVVCLFL